MWEVFRVHLDLWLTICSQCERNSAHNVAHNVDGMWRVCELKWRMKTLNDRNIFRWKITSYWILFEISTPSCVGESRELQEFLQIEKLALSETLKDAENEIETLKETIQAKENDVKEAEERCGHLVRLGERRHQELLTSTQQLKAFSDMAKSMLISQVWFTHLKLYWGKK